MEIIKGHKICGGRAEGEAIVYKGPFAFLGNVNPLTGKFTKGHELEGESLANKIFVFTTGRGSSQVARVGMETKRAGNAPAAMICLWADSVIAASAIMSEIPMLDKPDKDPFALIDTGDFVKVDATNGIIEITKKADH